MPDFKVLVAEIDGVELEYNQELQLEASNVAFTPTGKGYRSTSDSTNLALEEIRKLNVVTPQSIVTSLNGTTQLDNTSNTLQVVSGSATGYTIKLACFGFSNYEPNFLGATNRVVRGSLSRAHTRGR